MKFIITIKDAQGHFLAEHEEKAEPKFVALLDSYAFKFDKAFYLLIDRVAYNNLERNNNEDE